jgi:RNA-directed DNA polymerase
MNEDANPAGALDAIKFPKELNSFSDLEFRLAISRTTLRSFAQCCGRHYDPYNQSRKNRPFQRKELNQKPRPIDNPSLELRKIQRAINTNLLRNLTLPLFLCGGVKGRSVADNVAIHLGARVLITVDMEQFFPSISSIQVYGVWRDLGCGARIASLLTKLTTFQRHLPQGAPTSTMLANVVLYRAGLKIWAKCQKSGVAFSTWVDDIAFSGEDPRHIITTAVASLRDAGFAISHRKLKIMGPGDRKMLTGQLLGRIAGVHPQTLARVRSGVHKFASGAVPVEELFSYLRSLEGKIAHVSRISPKKGGRLSSQLDAAKLRFNEA